MVSIEMRVLSLAARTADESMRASGDNHASALRTMILTNRTFCFDWIVWAHGSTRIESVPAPGTDSERFDAIQDIQRVAFGCDDVEVMKAPVSMV